MKRIKKKLALSTETLRYVRGASTTDTYVDCPHKTVFCPPQPLPTAITFCINICTNVSVWFFC